MILSKRRDNGTWQIWPIASDPDDLRPDGAWERLLVVVDDKRVDEYVVAKPSWEVVVST